jgi:hypothetical protein
LHLGLPQTSGSLYYTILYPREKKKLKKGKLNLVSFSDPTLNSKAFYGHSFKKKKKKHIPKSYTQSLSTVSGGRDKYSRKIVATKHMTER